MGLVPIDPNPEATNMAGRRMRTRTAAGVAVVVAALAGGGGAIAATSLDEAKEDQAAILDDAAQQLGVESTALADALEQAYGDQLDARVAAGELTQAQADELKQRLAAGELPLLGLRGPGGGHHGGPGHHLGLDAAATFLGLTEAELRTELQDGSTLAEVAVEQGKTADALIAAMVAEEEAELAQRVTAGELTQAEADAKKADLQTRIADAVDNGFPQRGDGPPPGAPEAAPDGSPDTTPTTPPTTPDDGGTDDHHGAGRHDGLTPPHTAARPERPASRRGVRGFRRAARSPLCVPAHTPRYRVRSRRATSCERRARTTAPSPDGMESTEPRARDAAWPGADRAREPRAARRHVDRPR